MAPSAPARRATVVLLGEASFLATGYAVMTAELGQRLASWCRLVEYSGCSAPPEDPRWSSLSWEWFAAVPADPTLRQRWAENPVNAFGGPFWEEFCLRYKPDVVCCYRDAWMDHFVVDSPLRPYYRVVMMPTVDAEPLEEDWLNLYRRADALLTYSDYGREVLARQAPGLPPARTAAPGADTQVFVPVASRRAHKEGVGLDGDCLLVGLVARNQSRKLLPDLFRHFSGWLARGPADLTRRTYLYLHTAWPDIGWDIPRLLLEEGLSSRVLFTYGCRACGWVRPCFFQDARTVCPRCRQRELVMPNSTLGVTRQTLANVYNLMDVLVQYARGEGCGIPMLEAAACGVPVLAVDYSAMADVVRKLQGLPIRVAYLARESETHRLLAYPCAEDFARQLTEVLSWPEEYRRSRGYQGRLAVQRHYQWDQSAQVWVEALQQVLHRPVLPWDSPPQLVQEPRSLPASLNDAQFVQWGISQVAGRPDLVCSRVALEILRNLQQGFAHGPYGGKEMAEASLLGTRPRRVEFTRQTALELFRDMASRKNHWERARLSG